MTLSSISAKSVVWPEYSTVVDFPNGEGITLDQSFHLEQLNPIDIEKVRQKATEWDITISSDASLRWQAFDWVDEQGQMATGSRIVRFSGTARECRARAFDHSRFGPIGGPRLVEDGIKVPDSGQIHKH